MGPMPKRAPSAPAGRPATGRGRRPRSCRRASTPVTVQRKVMVVDYRNMLILEEKIARRELTPAQADKMLEDQGGTIKNWIGPLKDAAGSGKLFYRMAPDFGTWKGAQVHFAKSSAGHDLVVFMGWPARRKIITGTRYRLSHPKIVEMQIGKPGLGAAAKDSARFGIYLVVAVDIADYLLRDKATFG